MERKYHTDKSMKLFDESGEEYHIWIDQYAQKYGYYHRDVLHNREGIEVGVQLFGECARRHLTQHIMDDRMVDEEYIPTIQNLRDEETEMIKRIKERRKKP